MIQTEMIEDRIHHYSDAGFRIRQVETDLIFDDAVDVLPCRFTYEETDELIPEPEIPDEEALRIIRGEIE